MIKTWTRRLLPVPVITISITFGGLFATFVTLVLVPVLYFIGRDITRIMQRTRVEEPSIQGEVVNGI